MKILVITGDVSKRITPSNFKFLLTEVSYLADVKVWHEPGDIREIITHLGIKPDFVLLNEFGEKKPPVITGLASLTIPFAVYLHDLHYMTKQRKKSLQHNNVQYIFTHYRDKFFEWYPEFSDKVCWLPHHVNTNIFKDHGLTKDINWLLMGSVGETIYPLRRKIIDSMKNRPGFVYHIYGGHDHPKSVFVGEEFSKQINRTRMFFTCDSIFHYPIRKYYEVLASKALLLAPSSLELNDLGFIPGVHFIDINEDNFEEKAEYYLHNEKERLEITEQGYEMVRQKHSTAQRATELVHMVEDIICSRQSTN